MVVSPVLFGAGVKVKVIDALSYGQVVCSTSKTIEGTQLISGEHLIVEDDPNELAESCVQVLLDRKSYEKMSAKGLEFVKKYHSIHYQENILKEALGVN